MSAEVAALVTMASCNLAFIWLLSKGAKREHEYRVLLHRMQVHLEQHNKRFLEMLEKKYEVRSQEVN